MSGEEASAPAGRTIAGDQQVGVISGDRVCAACGFNLYGQPIVRERHYSMLIARCPECGAVVALQDYPLLGRWAARWGALLAVLWLLALLGALLVSGAALRAAASSVCAASSRPLATFIAEKHKAYQLEELKTPSPTSNTQTTSWYASQPVSDAAAIDYAWWKAQDVAALINEARAADRLSDWTGLLEWRMDGVAFFLCGAAWSGALIGVSRRRIWLIAPGVAATGAVMFMLHNDQAPAVAWTYMSSGQLAMAHLSRLQGWLTIVAAMVPLGVGAMLGRPIIRLAIRLLLPPRMRGSLALLWTVDGLAPPGVR